MPSLVLKLVSLRSAMSCALVAGGLLALSNPAAAQPRVVISQVFGGGGGASAPLNRDFIEIFNAGRSPANIGGWSVQYASAIGTTWQLTTIPADVVLAPGQYYLIAEGPAGVNGEPLPTPDLVGTIGLSQVNGKVALVENSTALTGACPSPESFVDFLGYGGANCAEGGLATPTLSNLTAAVRRESGCADTGVNRDDFAVTPIILPRNTSDAASVCPGPACNVDFNGDGNIDPDDLSDYITCFFEVPPCSAADFNGDGNADPDDLSDFITGFFQGCP